MKGIGRGEVGGAVMAATVSDFAMFLSVQRTLSRTEQEPLNLISVPLDLTAASAPSDLNSAGQSVLHR